MTNPVSKAESDQLISELLASIPDNLSPAEQVELLANMLPIAGLQTGGPMGAIKSLSNLAAHLIIYHAKPNIQGTRYAI